MVLDSPGGKVQPALEIGRVIRIKGFSTAGQGNQCASACALVWLAGEPRMMSTLTPIGFHASCAIDDQVKKTSDTAQGARTGAYLTGLGFNSKVVTFAVSAGATIRYVRRAPSCATPTSPRWRAPTATRASRSP